MHRRKTEISPSTLISLNEMKDYNSPQSRYTQQRRKIGLQARFSKGNEDVAQEYYLRRSTLQDYVKENFKRKECVRFVPKKNPKAKPGDPDRCHCGEVLEKHIKWTAGAQEYFQKGIGMVENDISTGKAGPTWSADSDIKEFTTNAFGKIDFINEGIGGHKPAKYLRIADNTDIDKVIGLMKQHWKMDRPHEPNLIITVIGGAKNFKLDGKKKDIFNEGLVAAAQTTHAWIITSGCNMGVMKAVGEAVAEGQTYNWDRFGMSHTLRCIGIAPWGYVERNEVLISRDSQGMWNASYKVSNIIKHLHPVSLNGNHTHFLLIDDGFRGKYSGVADFRAKLEKKLSTPVAEGGMGKHVVLVVVEGGTDAIRDVSRSLKQKIPVVLCEGTGRAADILAYAYNHFMTTRTGERKIGRKHEAVVEDLLVRAYGKTWEERSSVEKEQAVYLDLVLECCQDEKLITVFDMNKNEDLDLAILSALLKGQGAIDIEQLHTQLKLAVTWDRSDIAEEKIFNKDINWPQGKLDDVMTRALIEDKVNFVKLLLSNGVVMREYLTVKRLRDLYNKAPKSGHLYMFLKAYTGLDEFYLQDVGKLLRNLIGKHQDDTYKEDEMRMIKKLQKEDIEEFEKRTFSKPFRELFLWAVLMNRQELARFLWERGDEAIPSAIAASKIYEAMADKVAHYDHDMKDIYLQNKQEFEHLALKVLDECHFTDPEKAAMLIERKYPTWGGMTCLELASSANDKEFLSNVACQNSLNLSWKRGVTSSWWKVLLCIFFPPLVLFIIDFDDLGDSKENINGCQKLLTFFRAPMTKFAGNVVFYFIFLTLYSYVILFDFRDPIQVTEMVVLIWIFTMAMEETREMLFLSESASLKERLKVWWNFSAFNKIDLLIILTTAIGFVLRMIPGYLSEGKLFYCINCLLLFIRLLSFYSASSYLGPKLVMITRMFQELILYILILVVFLLAYGISSQSLQYPTRSFTINIFRDVFYYPYWQIYGELFLEELEGRTDECLGNNTGVVMSDGNPCPTYSWLVPALTAGYLLIGNVLLLNLLIAIFTHVFEEIEQNSIQIWKFGMYFLVVEYDVKPGLPPPFVIFEHVFLVFRWIFRKTCCKKESKVPQFTERQADLLNIFEKEMQKTLMQKSQAAPKDTLEVKINRIRNRVDEVAKLLEEERLLEHQILEAEKNSLKNNKELERLSLDSPKQRKYSARSPRGSSADLKQLIKNEMESRHNHDKQWNLNVINPVPAEMALEAKPKIFDDKDIESSKLDVMSNPKITISRQNSRITHSTPKMEKKISNLQSTSQVDDDNKTDVENAAVDDHDQEKDVYNKLDHLKIRQSEEDPNYGHLALRLHDKEEDSADSSDSEEQRRSRKETKSRGKIKRRNHQIFNAQSRNYENGSVASSSPIPAAPQPARPPPLQRDDSQVEERLLKVEENTNSRLSNIEALLQNFTSQQALGNIAAESSSSRQQSQSMDPQTSAAYVVSTNPKNPAARMAFGGPLGGYSSQPAQFVYGNYGYPSQPPVTQIHPQAGYVQGVGIFPPQQPYYTRMDSTPFAHSSPLTTRQGEEKGKKVRGKSADARSGGLHERSVEHMAPAGVAQSNISSVLPRFGYMDSQK